MTIGEEADVRCIPVTMTGKTVCLVEESAELERQTRAGGRTPCADESTDLAHGGGDAVELAAHSGRAALGGEHTEAVARAELAKAQEDAIHNLNASDVMRNTITLQPKGVLTANAPTCCVSLRGMFSASG